MAGERGAADAGRGTPVEGEERRATELIDYLARRLVDEPDAVRVETHEREDELVLRLFVADSDRGKVIGRQGRIVRSLRTVLRAASGRARRRLVLEIGD